MAPEERQAELDRRQAEKEEAEEREAIRHDGADPEFAGEANSLQFRSPQPKWTWSVRF